MQLDEFIPVVVDSVSEAKGEPVSIVVDASTEIVAFDMDSLDQMNFLLELEQRSGMLLGEVDLGDVLTVEALYNYAVEQVD